ncbi:MAG: hypothetical protein AAFU79_10465 [Myxococcota bacterium]
MARACQENDAGVFMVPPRSGRREALVFAGLISAVVAVVGVRVGTLALIGSDLSLQPYQRLDDVLARKPHTLYRLLLSSVPEVILLREDEGIWPEAELLAESFVPPYAAALVPSELRSYVWVGYDGGSWVDYLGQDQTGEGPTFILRLVDLHAGYHPHPHPGVDYDPELVVASQVWYAPTPRRPYPGERLPEAGWLWVLSPGNLETLSKGLKPETR